MNNLEFDHADIFEDLAAVQTAFSHLIRLVPRNGLLFANGDDAELTRLLEVTFCPVKRFGLGPQNAVVASDLQLGRRHPSSIWARCDIGLAWWVN